MPLLRNRDGPSGAIPVFFRARPKRRAPRRSDRQMAPDRVQHRSAHALAARAVPAVVAVGEVGVVLERHLQGQRHAAEAVRHPFARQAEQLLAEAAGLVGVVSENGKYSTLSNGA